MSRLEETLKHPFEPPQGTSGLLGDLEPKHDGAPARTPVLMLLAMNITLAAAYVLTARVGLRLAFANHNVTPVWPPTGVAIACLILAGRRLTPGVWLGALVANLMNGAPLAVAVGISVGNTLAPLLGATLLGHKRFLPTLERSIDVVALFFVGGFASMIVSATFGTATLALAGSVDHGTFGLTWFTWWMGDAMGVCLVAPIILTIARGDSEAMSRHPLRALGAFALIGVTIWAIFSSDLPLRYFALLVVIALSVPFEVVGASAMTLVAAGFSIWATLHGHPFVPQGSATSNLLYLQGFNFALAFSAITLAAVLGQRKRAEQRFRFIIEAAPSAMVMVDTKGVIQLVNSQAEALLGYARDELIGQTTEVFCHERDLPAWRELSSSYFADPRPFPLGSGPGFYVKRRDGSVVPVEMALNPIETEQGSSVLASLVDISERRRAERLEKDKAVSEETAKAKSVFLANMSHEIRTPISAVIGLTDLVLETQLDPKQRDFLETIRSSGAHLLSIVDDILAFSKFDGADMVIDDAPFEIKDIMDESIELVGHTSSTDHIRLTRSIDRGVPRAIVGDERRVRQVLVNLVSNALKFTERGNVEVGAARVAKDGDLVTLKLWVRDTGIGIAQDRLEDIFTEFTQADSTLSRKYQGTGLGLAICKRIVEAMGGTMWVESELGTGSTFSFTLRARMHSEEEADAEVVSAIGSRPFLPAPEEQGGVAHRPLKLLLVEDNAVNQKVALAMLAHFGLDAEVAEDGIEALSMIARSCYDAVLMDVQMPRMDGLEATREICRRLAPEMRPRIIGMTAHALDGDDEACYRAGMDDYLAKPVSVEALAGALSRIERRTTVGVATL